MNQTRWEKAIADHARRAAPQEACGVLLETEPGELEAVPLRNVHPEPVRFFRLDPETYPQLLASGRVRGYYHSHPSGPPAFSDADRTYIEETGIPAFLYSLPEERLLAQGPSGWMPPLEGRHYLPGINDCFALVRDWHRQNTGITLTFPPRTPAMSQTGLPEMAAVIEENHLVRVTGEPQPGDIFCLHIHSRSSRPNHLAVYVGAGNILHQLVTRPSEVTAWGGPWALMTSLQLRHESLLPAAPPPPAIFSPLEDFAPGKNMTPPHPITKETDITC